jgi:hypothetical protein
LNLPWAREFLQTAGFPEKTHSTRAYPAAYPTDHFGRCFLLATAAAKKVTRFVIRRFGSCETTCNDEYRKDLKLTVQFA